MSEKTKLEEIIASTLAEAKKKAMNAHKKHEREESEDEEENEHKKRMKEEVESLEETEEELEDEELDDSEEESEDENEEEVVEEETEQLDELSRKTLDSYMKKAARSAKAHGDIAGKKGINKKIAGAASEVASKRYSGLAAASKKVASAPEPAKKERVKKAAAPKAAPKGKKKKVKEEFENMSDVYNEESDAASTLHPAARSVSDPKSLNSKSLMMNDMMNLMAGMNKSDMLGFFDQVMSQYGPGKTYGVGDNSAQNQSSIQMKPSDANGAGTNVKMPMPQINAKEAVEEMFEGQDLSEEFMDRASVLFEAAINAKLAVKTAELEEQYLEAVSEQLQDFTTDLTDKLDCYLDYVVENWMQENQVAVDSALTTELTQEFISGLKNLFNEHYIDIPEEKVNVIEILASKVEVLESKLDEVITENTEIKAVLEESTKREVMEELSSDLALTQQEKFTSLAEGIDFDGDLDTYTKKLRIIKETYFKNGKSKAPVTSNINEETFEGEEVKELSPVMNRYAQALTRTTKI